MLKSLATDWDLVAQYLAGDSKSFDQLVMRYTPRLARHLNRRLWQIPEEERIPAVEDLLQEVFSRVARHAPRLDSRYVFQKWIYTVASNLANNEHRRRRTAFLRIPYQRDKETGSYAEIDTVDPAALPDAVVEARDTLERLFEYLQDHTSADNLECLELREVQGFSYEDIAKLVGIPIGTVKSRLARAREAAREFRDQDK